MAVCLNISEPHVQMQMHEVNNPTLIQKILVWFCVNKHDRYHNVLDPNWFVTR